MSVTGDSSNIFTLVQGTTIDGDVTLGGSMTQNVSDKSTTSGNTAVVLLGNLNGNFLIGQGAALTSIGNQARGIFIVAPIAPCADNAGLGYTCANSGTAAASTGAFINYGTIAVYGTFAPNRKGGNFESGSAVVIGSSVAGGFFNAGPSTSNGTTPSAAISGNGDVFSGSSGSVFSPTVLIDPSQAVSALNTTVPGPAVIGPVGTQVDLVDGGKGYAFINHGSITGQPIDPDVSALAVAIEGSSAVNFTCLGVLSGSACNTAAASGGLLNTGSIRAQSTTKEDTTSSITATGLYMGAFATVPRLDVAGEFISGSSYTAGIINAAVVGPGGGTATAVQIGDQANVPQIDVLQHGSITANIQTSTISPDSINAPASSPFTQNATAILDQSGSVRLINNAGLISALTTVQTPGANAFVVNNTLAINLLSGSTGNTVINDSGIIQGDVLFNAGGGGNVLNVGNVGDVTNPNDTTGNANSAISAVQGSAIANTIFNYASVTGRISGTDAGLPPNSVTNVISFGSGTGNLLHVGGFGYVNSVISSRTGRRGHPCRQ